MRKTFFAYNTKTKTVSAQLISAFIFATKIVGLVQSFYLLNTNFQASCHLLCDPGLSPTLAETPQTGFLVTRLNNDED